ncbi:hypothetical protein [Aquihabitans sp. McL0605]|uniref:hypothetical protein n=1 Tax=Aquihabitans sp. McL0605 TaxID=3415671 RepID=UPI003CF30AB8
MAVSALATACGSSKPPEPVAVSVVQDHHRAAIRLTPGKTIGDALEQAKVTPQEGQVLAAVTHKPVEPNGHAPVLRWNGRTVAASHRIDKAGKLEVIPGRDTPEATEVGERPLAPEGLPNALQYVQYAGVPGVEKVTVGVKSGEVVTRTTITPRSPPTAPPGRWSPSPSTTARTPPTPHRSSPS